MKNVQKNKRQSHFQMWMLSVVLGIIVIVSMYVINAEKIENWLVTSIVPMKTARISSQIFWNDEITRGEAAYVVVKYAAFEINTDGGPHFSDVPMDHSYYEAIETLVNLSALSAENEEFRPDENINRAEFSKLAYWAFGVRDLDPEASLPYTDVDFDTWYYDYIHGLYTNDVLPEKTQFRPTELANRSFAYQLAQKLASLRRMVVAELLVDGFDIPKNTSGGPHFSDVPSNHAYYTEIESLYNADPSSYILSSPFRPEDSVNKTEVAKLIVLAHEKFVLDIISNPSIRVLTMNNTCGFPSDVSEDSWYYSYVRDLYNHGVDVTDENCEFHPSNIADFSFTKAAIRGMGGEML